MSRDDRNVQNTESQALNTLNPHPRSVQNASNTAVTAPWLAQARSRGRKIIRGSQSQRELLDGVTTQRAVQVVQTVSQGFIVLQEGVGFCMLSQAFMQGSDRPQNVLRCMLHAFILCKTILGFGKSPQCRVTGFWGYGVTALQPVR